MEKVQISVKPIKVNTDPETEVYQIECESSNGVWNEAANTQKEVDMFIRGAWAMASLSGIKEPQINRI